MRTTRKARPSTCSHGCHNADFCIHQDEMRNTRKHNSDVAPMHHYGEMNMPVPSLPRVYRRLLGIHYRGERLVIPAKLAQSTAEE